VKTNFEPGHSTGHAKRLNRETLTKSDGFGGHEYGREELVAEMTAAMVGAELGLPVAHLDHHASYVASWLKVLKADNRAVLTAAAKAEEACSLLLRLGGRSVEHQEFAENEPQLLAA